MKKWIVFANLIGEDKNRTVVYYVSSETLDEAILLASKTNTIFTLPVKNIGFDENSEFYSAVKTAYGLRAVFWSAFEI